MTIRQSACALTAALALWPGPGALAQDPATAPPPSPTASFCAGLFPTSVRDGDASYDEGVRNRQQHHHCVSGFPRITGADPVDAATRNDWISEVLAADPAPETRTEAEAYETICNALGWAGAYEAATVTDPYSNLDVNYPERITTQTQVNSNLLAQYYPVEAAEWRTLFGEDAGRSAFAGVATRHCATAAAFLASPRLAESTLEDVWIENDDPNAGTYGTSLVLDAIVDVRTFGVAEMVDSLLGGTVHLSNMLVLSIAGFARTLFGIIAIFAFLWSGYQLIVRNGEVTEFLKTFAVLGATAAIFLFLLSPYEEEVPQGFASTTATTTMVGEVTTVRMIAIVAGVADWTSAAFREGVCDSTTGIGSSELVVQNMLCADTTDYSAGTIIQAGFWRAAHIFAAWNNLDIASQALTALPMAIGTISVAIIWMLIGFAFVMLWIEGYFVMIYGMFLLGFSAWEFSRDKAIAYLWYCVGWAFRTGLFMTLFALTYVGFMSAVSSSTLARTFTDGTAVSTGPEGVFSFVFYVIMEIIASALSWLLISNIMNTIGGFLGSHSSMANTMNRMVQQVATMGVMATGVGAAVKATQATGHLARSAGVATGAGAAVGAFKGAVGGLDTSSEGPEGMAARAGVARKAFVDNFTSRFKKTFMNQRSGGRR